MLHAWHHGHPTCDIAADTVFKCIPDKLGCRGVQPSRGLPLVDNPGYPIPSIGASLTVTPPAGMTDPYSRPAEKRGGAWMDEVVGQSRLLAPAGKDVRLPVAHMVRSLCKGIQRGMQKTAL